LNNPGDAFNGKLTTTGSEVSVLGETTTQPASASAALADAAVSQLESSMLANAIATQPGAMSPTAPGDGALLNVRLTVGANGPTLDIVDGGVRLPDYTVSADE
jgi:hypothetical protein